MILVIGAGGKTGKAIVKSLSKTEGVRALIHRAESASVIKALGAADVSIGDLRDEETVRAAMCDVRAIYHICPNMSPDEVGIGKLVIHEAKLAGVEHFVYHSVLHPQTEKMKHHWQKLRVEEMIFESGLPFTILQPAPYMQNLMGSWKIIVNDGVLHVPYSVEAKFSFIDLEDLAEVVRIVLTESGHKNAIYELAGTEPTSHVGIAVAFSRVLKRDIHAEKEEIDVWQSRVQGVSRYAIENLIKMFEYYDRWGLGGNPNVLRWVIKREPNSIEMFVRRIQKEHETDH